MSRRDRSPDRSERREPASGDSTSGEGLAAKQVRTPSGFGAGRRAQSHVVGVAVLLVATMLSLGMLTASVGVMIESSAAAVDADRVAADFDSSLEPVAASGVRRGRVSFTEGRLRVVERTIRVYNRSGEIYRDETGALVFSASESRVAFVTGAIVRGSGDGARTYADPLLAASEEVLLIGVARLNASGSDTVDANGATTVPLRTTVTHGRRALGSGEYRVAVETATPAPWERYFREQGATTARRDLDGDGVDSVVGHYAGNRTAYLVVHDLALEVNRG